MSRGFSVYLDGLRAMAAIIVLLSHFAYARFTDGDYLFIRELNLGSDAVILFFVLSGFVISFTTARSDRGAGHYFFQRATRIYSVAVPAVLLTLVCDRLGASIAPGAYDGWWFNPAPVESVLLYGLTFANQWGPFDVRLGSNGPYWSLSYEVAYYIMFGMFIYLSGWRRVVLLALCAGLFGLKALALMPAWLLGVAVHRALSNNLVVDRRVLLVLAVFPIIIYATLLGAGTPAALSSFTNDTIGAHAVKELRFSDEFIWNGMIGALFAIHIFAVGILLRDAHRASRLGDGIRWLAGASFSIYLVHYPLLQLIDAALPPMQTDIVRHLILLIATLALALGFAQLFERPLPRFRRVLLRHFGRRADRAPGAPAHKH